MASLDTEIRKLQPVELCGLAQILNHKDSWKKIMANVVNEENENIFNNIHFTMLEEAIHQQKRSGADIFLDEWSTYGKKRPTCRTLMDLLVKTELFRAADYLAVDILKIDLPERPKFGPAATVDASEKVLEELLKQQVAEISFESNGPDPQSWSLHFAEHPVNVISGIVEQDNSDQSDLMKFSSSKSDLMKFSHLDKGTLDKSPDQLSDLMKFSEEIDTEKSQVSDNYVLKDALSADIPLFVKDNSFQPGANISSTTKSLESESSTESYDTSETTMSQSVHMNPPNVSQTIIPLVVLEYNKKDEANA